MFKKCIICKKWFKTYKSEFKRRKTCSHKCNGIRSFRNKPKTLEHRKNIGLAHLGKKRKPFSVQWRKRLSMARKGKKFTKEHRENISLAQRMEKGNNWKGGRIKTTQGYIHIKRHEHPFRDRQGYVPEHRFIMEKHIGRFLKPCEVVHHINQIRHDNRIENLLLFASANEHNRFHAQLKKIT